MCAADVVVVYRDGSKGIVFAKVRRYNNVIFYITFDSGLENEVVTQNVQTVIVCDVTF